MDDLDKALARLVAIPVPDALDDIDAAVFARIDARAGARRGAAGLGAVALAALTIGVAGAALPATARPPQPLAPLSGASPLAPSTLLAGAP